MLFLLSPAKNLDLDPAPEGLETTSPSFKADIKALSEITRNLSVQDLKDLMGISDNLATLNHERFQVFQPTGRANQQKPAALAFNGDVYGSKHPDPGTALLGARSLTDFIRALWSASTAGYDATLSLGNGDGS